ncbi:MAG: hypothetical protein HY329_25840 [Chloroflexi bacterium]|nr:hypothetical protein [Chloroflexota bacterium]
MAALMLPLLLVFAALVIDTGFYYVLRRQAQNGADAAALGAAREIGAKRYAAANAIVTTLATTNGVTVTAVTYDPAAAIPSSATRKVTVATSGSTQAVLARLVGQPTLTANASATAAIAGLTSYSSTASSPLTRMVPLAVRVDEYTAHPYGTAAARYDLCLGALVSCAGQTFKFTSFGSATVPAPDYVSGMSVTTVTVGSIINLSAGQQAASMTELGRSTPPRFTGSYWVIPLIDDSAQVVGFSYFFVESVDASGNGSLLGYFVELGTPTAGPIGAGLGTNYGVYNVALAP